MNGVAGCHIHELRLNKGGQDQPEFAAEMLDRESLRCEVPVVEDPTWSAPKTQ